MMKFMMILMAVALVAVYSSPFLIDDEEKEDFQCCPQVGIWLTLPYLDIWENKLNETADVNFQVL